MNKADKEDNPTVLAINNKRQTNNMDKGPSVFAFLQILETCNSPKNREFKKVISSSVPLVSFNNMQKDSPELIKCCCSLSLLLSTTALDSALYIILYILHTFE